MISALEELGYICKVHDKLVSIQGSEANGRKAHILVHKKGKNERGIGITRENDGTFSIQLAPGENSWTKDFPQIVKLYASDVINKIVQSGPYQWESETIDAKGTKTIKLIVHE